MTVHYEADAPVVVITIDRPEVSNASDRPTAQALADAMRRFDADPGLSVAVLTGAGGKFCAGADLKAMNEPGGQRVNRVEVDGDGPVGPTRMLLSKPVIAAIEKLAVAGTLLLLYAQPLVKIVALKTTAIDLTPHETRISLGAESIPVPEPFASMLTDHLSNRPNLRTGGGMVATPWLFPGHRSGKHLDPQTMMMSLRNMGINLLGARNSAL